MDLAGVDLAGVEDGVEAVVVDGAEDGAGAGENTKVETTAVDDIIHAARHLTRSTKD